MLPTIVLIRDGKTEHSIIGFDEFGGVDDFATEDMAFVLSKYKVLNFDESDRYIHTHISITYSPTLIHNPTNHMNNRRVSIDIHIFLNVCIISVYVTADLKKWLRTP